MMIQVRHGPWMKGIVAIMVLECNDGRFRSLLCDHPSLHRGFVICHFSLNPQTFVVALFILDYQNMFLKCQKYYMKKCLLALVIQLTKENKERTLSKV